MSTCTDFAVLEISDGTDTVNLLDPRSGFFVTEWRPAIAGPKGDGVWQSSPLADGRRLIARPFDNAIESFTLQVRNWHPDALIKNTQDLRRLLEKAVSYWKTSWQEEPVWIRKQGKNETHDSYAIVHDYRTPNDGYPYGDVWDGLANAAIEDFSLVIERGHWLETRPGEGVCIEQSAQQTFMQQSATNLILNPGFEIPGGGGADIWLNWAETAGTGALADTGTCHGGAHACQETAGVALDTAASQTFAVTPLQSWILGLWTRGDGANAGRITVTDNTHGTVILYASTGISVATYTAVNWLFTVPSGCISITVYLNCPAVNGGICYFDDVGLVRYFNETSGKAAGCPESVEVLVNRGFEEIGTGAPDLWAFWNENVAGGAIGDSTPHTGNHACRLTSGGAANTYVYQEFNSVPGASCVLTFWSRAGDALDSPGIYQVYDVTHAANIVSGFASAGVVYLQSTITFTVPAGCIRVRVLFYCSAVNTDIEYYDDVSLTYDPICICADNKVYVANKHNLAQITDIYWNDVSAALWSDNLAEADPAYGLLPPVPAAAGGGDAVYFGCDSTLPDAGPFCSLVFDLLQGATDVTGLWDYWNGGWAALTVEDNTNGLTTTGVNSVHWLQPADWQTTAVHGVTGWWVRLHVGAIGAAPTPPIQQNRGVYSALTPFSAIDDAQVPGDIEALIRNHITNVSVTSGGVPSYGLQRFVIATRKTDRGTDFTPYINFSDTQQPDGLTTTAIGATTAFAANSTAITGRMATYTPLGAAAEDTRIEIAFSTALSRQYVGKFRIFGIMTADTANKFAVRLNLLMSTAAAWATVYSSALITVPVNFAGYIVDFGGFTIPYGQMNRLDFYQFGFLFRASATAAGTLNLWGLVMVPVDEFCIDTMTTPSLPTLLPNENILDVDGITYPRFGFVSNQKLGYGVDAGSIAVGWQVIGKDLKIQSNADQKMWFFGALSNSGYWCTHYYPTHTLLTYRQSRYLSFRGAR